MSGSGGGCMSNGRETETYEGGKITVNIERPDHWGEGFGVELAIELLKTRYYQLYAKKYTGPR